MQALMYSREQACIELQSLIRKWINEDDSRNISLLAKSAGVSENCIRRILNDNSLPITKNLQKIVLFLTKSKTNNELLSSVSKDLSSEITYGLSYLNFDEVKNNVPINELSKFVITDMEKIIFYRSSIHHGIKLSEIKESFGQLGLNSVQSLKSNCLVDIDNEYVKCIPELKDHSWNFEECKEGVKIQLENFLKTFSNFNYIFNVYDGVDMNGYLKLMDVIEEAHKNVSEIIKTNPGEIPVTISAALDTMTTFNYFDKMKEVEND